MRSGLRSGGLERLDAEKAKSANREQMEEEEVEKANSGTFVFFLFVVLIVAGLALYARGPEIFGKLTGLMWFQYIAIGLSMYNYIYGRE